jgi:hypothetical protein
MQRVHPERSQAQSRDLSALRSRFRYGILRLLSAALHAAQNDAKSRAQPYRRRGCLACCLVLIALAQSIAHAAPFNFQRDTFAFKNATVLKYKNGLPTLQRQLAADPTNQYTRRCFVMSRAVVQFRKFARFDLHDAPLKDRQLAARIRAVVRRAPWDTPLPENRRVVFSGYKDLRELSKTKTEVFQRNLGSGFATYFRPANARMLFQHSPKYQEKTHANLDATLARGDLFVAYLSTFPKLEINHAILIYGRKRGYSKDGFTRYLVYDPNHPEAPRELTWSPRECAFAYQKDIDFVGGFVRLYQCYGKPLQ